MYGYLIVVPLGLIFNILSIKVFSKWKQTSNTLHLICLAIADSVIILSSFSLRTDIYWTDKVNIPSFTIQNVWVCKLSIYLLSAGFLSSGLILASATIERFLCITFPLKIKLWNLKKISKALLLVYFLLALGLSVYLIFVMEVIEFPDKKRCFYSNQYVYDLMFKITQTVLSNSLCGGTIFIFTIFIAVSLFREKRRRRKLFKGTYSHKEFQITFMLLMVTCLFIALRLPLIIMQELFLYHSSLTPNLLIWWPLVNFLVVLNHSINFVVYIIFLNAFRSSFVELFLCEKKGSETSKSIINLRSSSGVGGNNEGKY